jgi:uncharacterized membrane protein
MVRHFQLSTAIVCICSGPLGACAQEWSIRPIGISNSAEVLATDINDAGDVTGFYYPPASINDNQGFLLKNGTITSFRYPGARFTEFEYFANDGDIVGSYVMQGGVERGYFRLHDGVFSQIPNVTGLGISKVDNDFSAIRYPGALSTMAYDSNDRGDVVGGYTMEGGDRFGFLFRDGVYSTIPNTVSIFSINNTGQMVGLSTVYGSDGVIIQEVPEPETIGLVAFGACCSIWLGRRIKGH